MSKIQLGTLFIFSIVVSVDGQYSRTWTQHAVTTANRFKLIFENADPGNIYIEQYNYSLFGPIYNHVTSVLYWNDEWYIKNEEGFEVAQGATFLVGKAGCDDSGS